MLKIRQKQTGKVENVSIAIWNDQYVYELWDIIERKDAVILYSNQSGKWKCHNIIEKSDAIEILDRDPNVWKFEDIPNIIDGKIQRSWEVKNLEDYFIWFLQMFGLCENEEDGCESDSIEVRGLTAEQIDACLFMLKKREFIKLEKGNVCLTEKGQVFFNEHDTPILIDPDDLIAEFLQEQFKIMTTTDVNINPTSKSKSISPPKIVLLMIKSKIVYDITIGVIALVVGTLILWWFGIIH